MSEFTEKERRCQALFESAGHYWHVYTSGKETAALFTCDEDMVFVMNVIAQFAHLFLESVHIIAFQVMNNHFHFIMEGREQDIRDFFDNVIKRLVRSLVNGDDPIRQKLRNIRLELKKINDLQSFRNNIVYVNRNGYVVNPSYTPFSYPWGTSRHYFMDFPKGKPLSSVKSMQARVIFRGRDPELPPQWELIDGYVSPASYCAIKSGEALFRDAHHYFYLISKNIESYSGVAADLEDGEFLTDPEIFNEITKILAVDYAGVKLACLTDAQKLDLARTMHYKYHSSNGQIRRILSLSQYVVNQLFHC